MNVARFVVDDPDGIVVDRTHYPQGTVVAFAALGEVYASVRDRLREEDPARDQVGQAAVMLDRAPYRPGGHAAGLRN